MMGSLIAKFLGVFREFYVLSYLEFSQEYSYYLSLIAILSLFTVLGNISILNPILFPIWIKFSGGKGVATYIGIITIISPIASISFLTIWIVIFLIFRYSSLSSIICSICTPIIYLGSHYILTNTQIINKLSSFNQDNFNINLIFILFMSTILIYRHNENIKRFLNGSEIKIK